MSQFLTQTTALMNGLASTPVWTSLGWTMWYYLWIGLVELACGILLLAMIPRFYSALRYRFLLVLFALLLVTPAFIFQSLWNEAARIDHSLTSEAGIPPIWTTVPVMVRAPAQEFVEPDRMPNALQPPWKPDPSAETPDRSLPEVSVTYPPIPRTPPESNGFGPLLFERLAKYVPWLPLIWMIGSPLTLLFLGLGLIGAERYRRQARVILAGDIVDQCAKLAARIGVRRKVLVAFSERVISPVLIGILKPLILLPITAETGWTPAQLEIVLLHELAHVRRWDNLVNLLQRLAEGILFFQPAVWIVSRWLTLEREHCCDELVVRVTGRAQDYATALAELALAEHLPPGVVSSMARHPLLGRIRRILGHEQPLQVSRATLVFALIFSIGCCALAGLTQSEEQPKATTETTPKEINKDSEFSPLSGKSWKFEEVNGKPIEGVEVSAFAWEKSYPPVPTNDPELRNPRKLIGKFISDAEGKVQVQTPDEKPFILEFKKPGFMTLLRSSEDWKRWVEDQDRPEFVPIELMRAGTITVEIKGSDGLPASGIKIGCSNYFRSKSLVDSNKYTDAVTDENGRAVFTNLREGLVNLGCTLQGYDPRNWSDCLLLADGAKVTVPIDLAQCNSSITGHVQEDLNQIALSGITIEIERNWDFDHAAKDLDEATRHRILDGMPTNQVAFPRDLLTHGRFPILRMWKGIQTDAEGKFDIGKIPAGNYHLTFIRDLPVEKSDPVNAAFQSLDAVINQKIAEKDVVLPSNETVPVEVLIDELSLEQEANGNSTIDPPIAINQEWVTKLEPEDSSPLSKKIERAIATARSRYLITGKHTPWQVLQAIHGLKRDSVLITDTQPLQKINALEWLATARTFQGEPLFEKTEWGGRAHPFTNPQVFEGHPTQFLAILSSCDLPLDYEFQTADGSPITVQDMINDAKMRVEEGTDLTWTLWALVHYLPVDSTWKNSKGEDWSIERMVKDLVEAQRDDLLPNGGSDMLYVLAYARNQYLKTGKPLEGIWLKADEKLKTQIELARNGKQPIFSFSAGFFDSPRTAPDSKQLPPTSIYKLSWLVMALSPEELKQEWIRTEIESLADDVYECRKKGADVGSHFHAIDALNLYRHRTGPNPKPLIYPLTGGKAGKNVSAEPSSPNPAIDADDQDAKLIDKHWKIADLNGSPLEGVEVTVSAGPEQQGDSPEMKALPHKHVSNKEGWFGGKFPRGKKLHLTLTKEGFLPVRLDFMDGRLQHENRETIAVHRGEPIEMMRCGTLVVTVLGKDGKPTPGQKVSLTNHFLIPSVGRDFKQDHNFTNEKGEITFLNLREGFVILRPIYYQESFVGEFNWGKPIFIADGKSHSVTIDTSSFSAVLEGSFTSSNPERTEGTLIEIQRDFNLAEELAKFDEVAARRIENAILKRLLAKQFVEKLRPDKSFVSSTRTDRSGKFRIEGLRPGKYVVRAMTETEEVPVTVLGPDGARTEIRRVRMTNATRQTGPTVRREKLVEMNVDLKPKQVTSVLLDSRDQQPQPQFKLERIENFDSLQGGRAAGETPLNKRPESVTRRNGIFVRDNPNPAPTRNITFRITTPLGRPLPGVIAEVFTQPELGKSAQQLPAEGASDHTGKLTIPLPTEGVFDCSFMENDGRRQGVTGNQGQISKSVGHARVKPGEWKEAEEIPVIIGRAGQLKVELNIPEQVARYTQFEGPQLFPIAGILHTHIPGFGTPGSSRGTSVNLDVEAQIESHHFQTPLDGKGHFLLAYPRGNSSFSTYPTIYTALPRHLQPEPALFSSIEAGYKNGRTGVSWVEEIPFDHEATETRTIDLNQCVCQIRGSVKNEQGESLPKVEIRVNRHLPPLTKDGPLSRDREIPIPLWDVIPRSNEMGEFAIDNQQPGKVAIYAIQPGGKASETIYADLTPEKPVEANLIIDQSKPLPETPKHLLEAIEKPTPMPIPPTPITTHPEIPPGKVPPKKVDSGLTSVPPGPQSSIEPSAVKKSPLLHIELKGESAQVTPENLRYDGKPFHEWVEVLRTEIKTERVVEAINVMTIFGARGYEKVAATEIADVLRRAPQTQALRASMEFSQVMSASAVAFHLLGPAAIPELVALLNSKEPRETITSLELLSPPATEDPGNWPDSLPLPSTDGNIGRSYQYKVSNGVTLGKGNAELTATLKSLLKHPNPEIRGRVLPAAIGCQLNAAETSEILSTVLQDPEPAVWFSAIGMVARPTPLKYPREALKESYSKLKEAKILQTDWVRRQRFLEALLSESAHQPPEELSQYVPDILDDLKESPDPKETAYWHLMTRVIPVFSEKAPLFRDTVHKAAAALPDDQKARVEKILKSIDPEIEELRSGNRPEKLD